MILSFHPLFEADKQILCAGREPDHTDIAAIKKAFAVILPQGCSESLYRAARKHCTRIFPNFDARFAYPGKTGQAKLFTAHNAPFPETITFKNSIDYGNQYDAGFTRPPMTYPFVFKLDWGGQGDGVFLIRTRHDFKIAMSKATAFEASGQSGFLIQEYVNGPSKTLRIAVIGETRIPYWRIQEEDDVFGTSVAKGAVIDKTADPESMETALLLTQQFCRQTRINMAGFDLIFSGEGNEKTGPIPLFLEINYFFGRRGIGGSGRYYDILEQELSKWLNLITTAVS